MPLTTNVQAGDPGHAGLHNEERGAINATEVVALAAVPRLSGIEVVDYSADVSAARPNAAVVWWVGAAGGPDPDNWIVGDAIFTPDVV